MLEDPQYDDYEDADGLGAPRGIFVALGITAAVGLVLAVILGFVL